MHHVCGFSDSTCSLGPATYRWSSAIPFVRPLGAPRSCSRNTVLLYILDLNAPCSACDCYPSCQSQCALCGASCLIQSVEKLLSSFHSAQMCKNTNL